MELIGSRARHHLNLSGTARSFGIDNRRDDSNFFDEIGTDIRVRECAEVVSAVGYDETISRGIDGTQPRSCKVTLEPVAGCRAGTGSRQHEIQNVASRKRQVAH